MPLTPQLHNATRSAGSGEVRRPPPLWPGLVTALTAGYAIAYLWWERTGIGNTMLRDVMGNVGFMPFNLVCLVLNGLASRNRDLDPGVRRALRFRSAAWQF